VLDELVAPLEKASDLARVEMRFHRGLDLLIGQRNERVPKTSIDPRDPIVEKLALDLKRAGMIDSLIPTPMGVSDTTRAVRRKSRISSSVEKGIGSPFTSSLQAKQAIQAKQAAPEFAPRAQRPTSLPSRPR